MSEVAGDPEGGSAGSPGREISPKDPHPRHRIDVLDSYMAYVDTAPPTEAAPAGPGAGSALGPVVFLHGNPTSSYLWRNVIPHVSPLARCLAPDLIGMGGSGTTSDGSYRFVDHRRYLDSWLEAVGAADAPGGVAFVVHDWGSGLAFDWARRHPDRVRGIAYMEAIVKPMTWDEWPEAPRSLFQAMRTEAGEEIVLEKNVFVERILPSSVLRDLTEEEMEVYREPFREPGEVRRPTLTWPRELPIDGSPADMVEIVGAYADWLAGSAVPKLFVAADPGAILIGAQRDFARSWPNQTEVTVSGSHFVQEDSPHEIGEAVAEWIQRL